MRKSCLLLSYAASIAALVAEPTLTVDVAHPAGKVSPRLYGLMTEEINHCYDGGLYAELIRNRAFLDDKDRPVHWSVVSGNGADATFTLDPVNPCNAKLTTSLRVTVAQASAAHPAGVANAGYWGIPVQPRTRYRATLIARAEPGFSGPVTVSIVSEDGLVVYAQEKLSGLSPQWNRFQTTLKTGRLTPTAKALFRITLDQPGTVWLGLVSLFPPTWNDRPNGLRKDLMQMLVDLKPKFLRFPGGNYLEGETIETRFQWKNTIGPIEERRGHPCPWGYRSTDGMGLLEFLEWCEDMQAEPVLAVYAGYSLRGDYVKAGPDLEPFVQEALEEIEYVVGSTSTTWGARRARDGHPAPFRLNYVEIGNEDGFDKAKSYDGRFAQFYDAIKAKFPRLKIISTVSNDDLRTRKGDMVDLHFYSSTDEFIRMSRDFGSNFNRNGPEIFVGEWAAHEDSAVRPWDPPAKKLPPTPSMKAAIGDAVFLAAMERNSDIILMQCYAPLLVNVNPGAWQWRPDLIGYDALSAYGSPSYYAIQMFSRNLGDELLPVQLTDTSVHASATRDSKTGEVFLKLVNPQPNPQNLRLDIKGVRSLAPKATVTTLAASPDDTNSIDHPRRVAPVVTALRGPHPSFTYTLPPHGVVALRLKARR